MSTHPGHGVMGNGMYFVWNVQIRKCAFNRNMQHFKYYLSPALCVASLSALIRKHTAFRFCSFSNSQFGFVLVEIERVERPSERLILLRDFLIYIFSHLSRGFASANKIYELHSLQLIKQLNLNGNIKYNLFISEFWDESKCSNNEVNNASVSKMKKPNTDRMRDRERAKHRTYINISSFEVGSFSLLLSEICFRYRLKFH